MAFAFIGLMRIMASPEKTVVARPAPPADRFTCAARFSGHGTQCALTARRCSTLNSSIRYCALRPAPQLPKYRQALACPRAAQKSATYRSPRFHQWQRWCRRQAR